MSVRCRIVLLIAVVLPSAGVGRAEDGKLERHCYNVTDLIVSLGDAAKGDNSAGAPASNGSWAVARETQPENGANQLIRLLTNTIAPQSWSERGGPGTIEYFPLTTSLVVNQSPEVQDQIQDLLTALRRKYDQEVAVEVKFVTISDGMFQSLKHGGILGDPKEGKNKKSEPKSVVFLSDREVFLLMEMLQGDTRTNVMQAPKLVAANGQTARLNVLDKQYFVTGLDISQRDGHVECRPKTEEIPLGVRICLRPIISADRRFVRLHFDATLSSLASGEVSRVPIILPAQPKSDGPADGKPQTVTQYIEQPKVERADADQTLVIPNQCTAVLSGWHTEREGRCTFGPPILSDIPYLGRLFRTTGYGHETLHLLICVTPRIVVAQEKEQRASPSPSAKSCPKASAECVSAIPARFCPTESDEEKSTVAADHRTLVLPPLREGETSACAEMLDEARILRGMPPIKNPFPGIVQVSRENTQIVTEKLTDQVDPPRFFPLVGPARLHHCRWKCTVYYTETIEGVHPALDFRSAKVKTQTIYVDGDHLHLCDPDEAAVMKQNLGIERCSAVANPPRDQAKAKKLADLLKQFEAACESDRFEEAMKLAKRALELDPTCFRKH